MAALIEPANATPLVLPTCSPPLRYSVGKRIAHTAFSCQLVCFGAIERIKADSPVHELWRAIKCAKPYKAWNAQFVAYQELHLST